MKFRLASSCQCKNGHACAPFFLGPENLNTKFRGNERLAPSLVSDDFPWKRWRLAWGRANGNFGAQARNSCSVSFELNFERVARLSPYDVQFDQSTLEIARQRVRRRTEKRSEFQSANLDRNNRARVIFERAALRNEEKSSRALVQKMPVRHHSWLTSLLPQLYRRVCTNGF